MLNKWITGIMINRLAMLKTGIFTGQMEEFFLSV
jgi:hypothetical protein